MKLIEVKTIIEEVYGICDISVTTGDASDKNARFIYINLCLRYRDELCKFNYIEMNNIIGRDYGSISHSVKRHQYLLRRDKEYISMYSKCTAILEARLSSNSNRYLLELLEEKEKCKGYIKEIIRMDLIIKGFKRV
jgi:hypothetical protein